LWGALSPPTNWMEPMRDRRGSLYLVSYVFLTVLSLGLAVGFGRSTVELRSSQRALEQTQAFYLAEAAVDRALVNLRSGITDSIYDTGLGSGAYAATIVSPEPNVYQVTGEGKDTSGNLRTIETTTHVVPESVFQFALFGDQNVSVSGSAVTDSYDSSLGDYGSQTPGENGDIGTNSTEVGSVDVSGSIAVNGQAFVGPGVADPESIVTGGGTTLITGEPPVVSMPGTIDMPPVVVPETLSCTPLTVNGNDTVTLSSAVGEYCFTDVDVEGGGTLTSDGPVTVYLTGNLHAAGNTAIGVEHDPTQMLFLVTSSSEGATIEGTITGSSAFYGALYGPDATITITGNAEVYGSMIAGSVDLSGSAELHYDEALQSLMTIPGSYLTSVLYWRDVEP